MIRPFFGPNKSFDESPETSQEREVEGTSRHGLVAVRLACCRSWLALRLVTCLYPATARASSSAVSSLRNAVYGADAENYNAY